MALTSYAQNFEDVILWRALRGVTRGNYIDVGAQDPEIDSVSLVFHQNGWRGVHVEPSPKYAEALRKSRPNDLVIEAAVGGAGDSVVFFEIAGTGLSTSIPELAEQHLFQGHEATERRVPSIALSTVLDHFSGRDVHWLKVDAEGMEDQVLASWLPSTCRPWIVVVESTRPTSPELTDCTWEAGLINLGYQFVYFDGLNRFYLSTAHHELRAFFGPGPNVFDGFELSGLASAPFCRRLKRELADKDATLDQLQRDMAAAASLANSKLRAAQVAQQALIESTSWRITLPLRVLRETTNYISSKFRGNARIALLQLQYYVRTRPRVKRVARLLLRMSPFIRDRFILRNNTAPSQVVSSPHERGAIYPHARAILAGLRTELSRKKNETSN